jgi:hypothetical protein
VNDTLRQDKPTEYLLAQDFRSLAGLFSQARQKAQ